MTHVVAFLGGVAVTALIVVGIVARAAWRWIG